MKICIDCRIEKPLSEFYKNLKWYRGRCKSCHNMKFQPKSGKPNMGRFRKGNKPLAPFKKSHIPWNTGRSWSNEMRIKMEQFFISKRTGISRRSFRALEWRKSVLKKYDFKCQFCGIKEKLEVHHIIPFQDSIALRFDVDNGTVYCKRCHNKIERTKDVNKI